MVKICETCGKEFEVKDSHAHARRNCSRDCMALSYRGRLRGEDNPHWKGGNVKKTCPVCGKEFEVFPAEKDKRKCCSVLCAGEARKTRACKTCGEPPGRGRVYCERCRPPGKMAYYCRDCGQTIKKGRVYCVACSPRGKATTTSWCKVCGKKFQHWKGLNRRYCSHECRLKDFSGEGNPNWKGGRLSLAQRIRGCKKNRTLIAAILKRDKYTCQLCGQVGSRLEVDHKKPFSKILEEFLREHHVLDIPAFEYELYLAALKYKPFWDKDNLRTLCRGCNWKRHLEPEWIDGTIEEILK